MVQALYPDLFLFDSCVSRSESCLLHRGCASFSTPECLQGDRKRARTAAKRLNRLADLKQYALCYTEPLRLMPPSGTQVAVQAVADALVAYPGGTKVIHVPMDCAQYNTEGLVFTGPVQLGWIKQCLARPHCFVLHVDGKHKLHHGGWVLMTVGTHYLRYDEKHNCLSASFAPLVYLMCKQIETGSVDALGSANMLVDALDFVAFRCFGEALQPGAGISDHCPAYFGAYKRAFPEMPFAQCWPHLAGKFRKGEYTKTTWKHFEDASRHIRLIHMAITEEARDLLTAQCGKAWDKWGHQMDMFWDSNCRPPWNCWSMTLECPLATPNNNPQESWHKELSTKKIPNMFRGSTESVFSVALPQLIEQDGLQKPSVLPYNVPMLPLLMLEKALWYVVNKDTHVKAFQMDDASVAFFVLAKDNAYGAKKITQKLMQMYNKLMIGEMDARLKDLDSLLDLSASLHVVYDAGERYPPLEAGTANACGYSCMGCKAFQGIGICSHVLAINHIMKKFNVRYELRQVQTDASKQKAKRGGNTLKPPSALVRVPVATPTAADDEEERLQALGMQGQ